MILIKILGRIQEMEHEQELIPEPRSNQRRQQPHLDYPFSTFASKNEEPFEDSSCGTLQTNLPLSGIPFGRMLLDQDSQN